MKAARKETARGFPLYLVPIVVGMCGVLFSHQISDPGFRVVVVLASVAAPLLAGGNLLARLYSQGSERLMIMGGLALLFVGALVTASGFTDDLNRLDEVPESIVVLSRYLGLASLFVGLIALLVMFIRREEAIGEIGDRFGHLSENMNDGLVLTAPDGAIVLVNQCVLDMLGMNEDEILGHNAAELAARLGLEEAALLPTGGRRAEAAEFAWTVNTEQRHFSVNASVVRTRQGQRAGYLTTVRDITEQTRLAQRLEKFAQGLQKLVEDRTQKLRVSEGRLRELLLHMNEGFLTVDGEYRIVFANEKMAEMLGAPVSDLIKRSLFDCVDPSERTRLYDVFERADADPEEGVSRELAVLGAGGRVYSAVAAISRIRETGENAARFSIVLTDVSRLKDMQRQLEVRAEELERANEELRMLDRAKDTFLSNVTHELRTPLSTIRGYVEMLESAQLGPLPAGAANALTIMNRNAERLGTLIDEMIEFSRMEIRGIRLVVSLFDLDSLLAESVASAKPQLDARGMTATVEFDPAVRLIWSDRKRLGQVVTILISNAVKFSPDNAVIALRAYARDRRDVAIEVADRGIGIDPRFHRRVFDKFFQVDSAMTRRFEGAGIGLSVAKSIVEAHGGRIEIESAVGEGSTFRIALPSAAFAGGGEPAPLGAAETAVDVLLCDEDACLTDAMTSVLETAGCRVQAVRSGYECLRKFETMESGVVVIGMATQDLSAIEVFGRLSERRGPVVRIVRCVAAGIADTERQLDAGQAAILPVPFSASELIEGVATAAGVREPDGAALLPAAEPIASEPHVALFDDDAEFCAWMRKALSRRRVHCACAGAAEEAVAQDWGALDTVFVDLDRDNGARAAEFAARRNGAGPAVVGMTCSESVRPEGLDAVLQKPFRLEAVLSAIGRRPPADRYEDAAKP